MILVVILYLLSVCLLGDSKVYRSIIWSPENPIFQQNRIKCVLPTSRLFIICPSVLFIVNDREELPSKENLFENLWFVDEQAFKSCQVNKTGRLLKICNTPLTQSKYDFMFLATNPLTGGLEFDFGKDYYIIATSNGTEKSLTNRVGGHCKTNNMKLRLHICNDSKDPHCLSEENCQQLLKRAVEPDDSPTKSRSKNPTTPQPTNTARVCNTTQPTTKHVPPNSSHYFASIEVYYRLSIGLLGFACVILLVTTICLAHRLYRVKKMHSDCVQNKNFDVRLTRASNGSAAVDANDAATLITRTGSERTA